MWPGHRPFCRRSAQQPNFYFAQPCSSSHHSERQFWSLYLSMGSHHSKHQVQNLKIEFMLRSSSNLLLTRQLFTACRYLLLRFCPPHLLCPWSYINTCHFLSDHEPPVLWATAHASLSGLFSGHPHPTFPTPVG